MAETKIYDGRNWVQAKRMKNMQARDGDHWVNDNNRWQGWNHVNIFDGHDWHDSLQNDFERRTHTWNATWSQSYWSNNVRNGAYNNKHKGEWRVSWGPNRPVQGSYYHPREYWVDNWDYGNEGGMIGFDDGNMRWELSGSRIIRVQLYLHSLHSWYWNGGEAVVGTHNCRGWQGWFNERDHGIARRRYTTRDQGQWIDLPTWVGDGLRDNWLSGITTKADGNAGRQYMVFGGSGDGWKAPKLCITYDKPI